MCTVPVSVSPYFSPSHHDAIFTQRHHTVHVYSRLACGRHISIVFVSMSLVVVVFVSFFFLNSSGLCVIISDNYHEFSEPTIFVEHTHSQRISHSLSNQNRLNESQPAKERMNMWSLQTLTQKSIRHYMSVWCRFTRLNSPEKTE